MTREQQDITDSEIEANHIRAKAFRRTPSAMDMSPGTSPSDDIFERLVNELPQQYEVLGKATKGAMGAIYRAQNRYTHAQLAIKVLNTDCARDSTMVQRFVAEARATASLKHPRICQVHDFGLTESQMPYLVMDWIDGISLAHKIKRDSHLPVREAIAVFIQITEALAHAHERKVVHRDLKPDNVMLSRDDEGRTQIRLVDFGIAKVLSDESNLLKEALTQTGVVVGTPTYMAPEQARGETVDGRSDIYSLGCLMYYSLTGKPPFLGATIIDTMHMHCNDAPPAMAPALKVPPDLNLINLKCLEKSPGDRYRNVEEVNSDLKKLLKGEAIKSKPLASQRKLTEKRRNTVVNFFLVFVAVFVFCMILFALMDSTSANKHSAEVDSRADNQVRTGKN